MLKKEISPGVIQLTLDEERWYFIEDTPYPSVTWILNYYPKGIGMTIWLAEKVFSWEQAKQVMREAGEQGSKVHWGLEQYLLGAPLCLSDVPPESAYPFTAKEWQMIETGIRYIEESPRLTIGVEQTVFGDDYAGTIDWFYEKDGKRWILDWKTGGAIYPSYKAQQAAYVKALQDAGQKVEGFKIVRLGSRHKKGYEEYTGGAEEIEYYYDLFRCAMRFWQDDNPAPAPSIIEVKEAYNVKEEGDEEELEDAGEF